MKTASLLTLIVALFIASVMLTSISVLCSLDRPSEDIRMADLAAGRLGPMLSGPTLWNRYPSFPPHTALFDYYAMFLVGSLVAVTFYVLRTRFRGSLGAVSMAVLVLGAVPYLQGMLVLQTNTPALDTSGPWLAVMLVGVFYATLVAAVLATMELTNWHNKAVASVVRRFGRSSSLRSPASSL